MSGVKASESIRDEAELGTSVGGLLTQASVAGGVMGVAVSTGMLKLGLAAGVGIGTGGAGALAAGVFAVRVPNIGRRLGVSFASLVSRPAVGDVSL